MSTLRVNNLTAVGGTGTITVPTGNTIGQVDTPTGLVLLSSASFSAVSSVSMPAETFTSTYPMYKVMFRLTAASADLEVSMRVNNAGTPRTAANYNGAGVLGQDNGYSNFQATSGGTSFGFGACTSANPFYSAEISVYRPTESGSYTSWTSTWAGGRPGGVPSTDCGGTYGGSYFVNEANDGLTWIASTGNFTGNWYVYGFKV